MNVMFGNTELFRGAVAFLGLLFFSVLAVAGVFSA
jgi:hypothetical protein